jgi:Sodium/calcium exchanger protein
VLTQDASRLFRATLAGITILVALVSEVFVESVQQAAVAFGMTSAFVGFIVVALVGGAAEMASAFSAAQGSAGPERGHRPGERIANRALRCSHSGTVQLRHRSSADGPAILAECSGNDAHCHHDRVARDQQRAVGMVCGSPHTDGVPDFRHDALLVAAPVTMKEPPPSKHS